MIKAPFKILLVEDNPGDARLIKEMLADARAQDLIVEWVSRLADGLEQLSRDKFDLVLLDLDLPDSSGLDTFIKTHAKAPQVPIVVLSGLADETLALTAVRQGAQDYLFKNEINFNQLLRAIRYATERKQADEKLRESEQNLRLLASQLLTAQERERERISRELHDELGQSLLVLKLQAGHIKKMLNQDQTEIRQECQKMLSQLDHLVGEVRLLARDLTPTMVKDLGLSSALRRLIEDFSRHYDIQGEIDLIHGIDAFLSREAQINIYRIFQESLTNIGKYAQASHLTVTIKPEAGQVSFLIADNGRGFQVEEVWGRDPANRGLGLMAMEERVRMMGGNWRIWSQEGQGTQLAFIIPVRSHQAD
jgi:signal transduction histidine kinase